ncbi:MAG: arginine--tRNA ligase [Bacilli bacterium]|nr:arginine--tRNA ligase [Bacilli bacterium]
MTNEELLKSAIKSALEKCGIEALDNEIVIERTRDEAHGDYATNVAMRLSRKAGKKPIDFANDLVANIASDNIDKVEIAGPGFINFFLKKASLGSVVSTIINMGSEWGQGAPKGKKINVEFVSANPTGDLHLGHTRGAALGDATANLYRKAGYDVTKEYYVNDCGNQVAHLGNSIRCRYHELFGEKCELGQDDYHGVSLIKIAESIKEQYGDKYLVDNEESKAFFIRYGIDTNLAGIKKDMADFGVVFDKFSYESDIRKGGTIEKTIEDLKSKGYIYEQEGATFLRTTDFLDDKDRPIIKADGCYTYFMPDICYHYNKVERGYDTLVDMLGADHHGYINRMKSALMMKGCSKDTLEVEIYQIVKVFKDGEEVKMSKRTGKAVSHRELVEEVGSDAVRYIFCERSGDAHLDFDMNLALSKSKDNPVYYAQYAHARCHSLLEMGKDIGIDSAGSKLSGSKESDILKQLAEFPSMILSAAEIRAPYKVANYIQKLASMIHEYYAATKIIDRNDIDSSKARLGLILACKITLENALAILGVSAPDKM